MKHKTHNAGALLFGMLIVGLAMGLHIESALAQEGHGHESPHGGQVRTLGDYHVEFVVEENGEIAVYLSDKNQRPLSVKDARGVINLKMGSSYQKLDLKPNTDETYLEAEIDLQKMNEFEAGVQLTIKGRKYSNVVFKYSGHEAMPQEQLKGIFPKAHQFVSKHATLSATQIGAIESGLKGYDPANAKIGPTEKALHVYLALDEGGQAMGAALMLNVMGPGQTKMGELVGIDSAAKVAGVVLIAHHEEGHGAPKAEHIAEFLKQFTGKTVESNLMLGQEIKAGADAKASAAIATGVKKALLVWKEVKDHLSDDEHEDAHHEGHGKSKDHHDEH
ncbi:hypothetical protein HYR99_08025 [Candidatus Poribacteria bacterium]|nr:hypothetical protein [Candidatus Poribacteria bacterium]